MDAVCAAKGSRRDLYTGHYLKHDLRREQHESRQILTVGNVSWIEESGEICVTQECGEECVCERIETLFRNMGKVVEIRKTERGRSKDFQSGSDGSGLILKGLDQNNMASMVPRFGEAMSSSMDQLVFFGFSGFLSLCDYSMYVF